MDRFDGTLARQLELLDDEHELPVRKVRPIATPRPSLRMLQRDVYAELARRRRRAQIAARHLLDKM